MMSRRRWALSLFQLGYVMQRQGREEVAQTIYNQGHSLGSGEKSELRQEVVIENKNMVMMLRSSDVSYDKERATKMSAVTA